MGLGRYGSAGTGYGSTRKGYRLTLGHEWLLKLWRTMLGFPDADEVLGQIKLPAYTLLLDLPDADLPELPAES